MNFGANLKGLREAKNLTQDELAIDLQLARPTIAGYESLNRHPDYEKLEQIASYFNVTIDYLIRGEDYPIDYNGNKKDMEKNIAYKIGIECKLLSPESQQDLLKQMELLRMRDRKTEKQKNKK